MKIAFIGYGNVGAPLADHLQRLGHEVVLVGEGGSESLKNALARNPGLSGAPMDAALREAEVVFLAVPWAAAGGVVEGARALLAGKVLVDCTNPVGAGLKHGLDSRRSGSEELQAKAPEAKVVKAFTIYGYENFEDARYPGYGVAPAMLFCGDDAAAKATVGELIRALGWEPVDVGGLVQALHLEHMTLLWVRMVRVHGASPHLVWAALRR